MKGHKKAIIICCSVTVALILTLSITVLVLFLTILKPKQPILTSQPAVLHNIVGFNVTLGLTITVDNHRNYGSFHYNESTTSINYRGTLVGEAAIKEDTIPARKKHDIVTAVVVFGDRLLLNPGFPGDVFTGVFNFTASTTLHGKVKVWKILKSKATTYTTCDISVHVLDQIVTSVCNEKTHL